MLFDESSITWLCDWCFFIFSKDVCVWLYCLLAFVEMPLSSGVCGTIRGIYRRLSEYAIDNEELQTCVDVVKVICSRFFNQKFWVVWEIHAI